MRLHIELFLDSDVVLRSGVADALGSAYLRRDGVVVIPVDLGGGVRVNSLACGKWEWVMEEGDE